MIDFKLHTQSLVKANMRGERSKRWTWLARFLFKNLFSIRLSNFTMEKGESVIIHSELRADLSVAVKVEDDGTLVVLLNPPSVESHRIELRMAEPRQLNSEKVVSATPDVAALFQTPKEQ